MLFERGKHYWLIATAITLLTFGLLSCAGEKSSQAQEQDKTSAKENAAGDKAAMVNGTLISKAELDQEIERIQQQFSHRGMTLDDEKLAKLRKEVLENLINTELLYQQSQKVGITVEDAAINEQIETIKKQFPDEAKFQEELTKLNFSEDGLKNQIRKGLSIQQLINKEIGEKMEISDNETEEYYKNNPEEFKQSERVRASHILIKVDPGADDKQKAKARKEIEEVQARLKNGGDFGELAKEFSQCPSAGRAGDLGYFGHGQMVKPFEETVFALKPDEVSNVVETQFGYHLIKLVDKKPENTIPYDSIKSSLAKELKQRKIKNEIGEYVKKLEKEGKVENFLAN